MRKTEYRKAESESSSMVPVLRLMLSSIAALWLYSPANAASTSFRWTGTQSSDYNTRSNWIPTGVPNKSFDVAHFGVSTTTTVSLSRGVLVNRIVFNVGASTYTIAVPAATTLTIEGNRIANRSTAVQTLQTFGGLGSGPISFTNGESLANIDPHPQSSGAGVITFRNASSAGKHSDAFVSNGAATQGDFPGAIRFFSTSTANSSSITNVGSTVNGGFGGFTSFSGMSSAGSASLTASGGTNGGMGGMIIFDKASTGGTSTVTLTGNGLLDISLHDAPDVTIGSLKGTGNVFLGANNLTVGAKAVKAGAKNVAASFSGIIQDGSLTGSTNASNGGSLTKIGARKLILSGVNTYSGGTFINGGTLAISDDSNLGSASGSLNFSNGGTLTTRESVTSARSGVFGTGGAVIDTFKHSKFSGVFSGTVG